ncbi:thioredoxin reductase [Chaetomium fimeti]|uniref:Thioredoxin reductase n=1 Tax=Chaetomium fimeti TaxID=1854472 RepID=A0AAE0HDI1_9PEZI|nr:thioredoxin reductase [Chaetomium fimeti]
MERFAESLATALNAAGIPCVLWGQYLLQVHGASTIVCAIDFVIPDESLEAAKEVIKTGHFSIPVYACADTMTCLSGNSPGRTHPHPSIHMHMDLGTTQSVGLYVQSETLWFLPPLSATLASPKTNPLPPYFALASDRTALPTDEMTTGRGIFNSDETVVIVPKAHTMTEALMRIMARDNGKTVGGNSVPHFCYIFFFIERRGILDINLLPESLKKFYEEFRDGPAAIGQIEIKLKRALGIPVPLRFYH